MNILDLIILCFIFIIMIQSYRIGFLDELINLIVIILSGYGAYSLSSYLIPYLDFFSNNRVILRIFAGIILFIIFFIVGKMIKTFILDLINETEMSGFDKFMGMALGFLKGIVMVSAFIMVFSSCQASPISNLINDSLIAHNIIGAVSKYKELLFHTI